MASRRPVALVSAPAAQHLDDDLPPLVHALERTGVEACVVHWDDPSVRWSRFDLVVVRSTWDYPSRLHDFLAWAAATDAVTRLANPFDVLRWGCDKHYLLDLAAAGVPVVPTSVLRPGDRIDLPAGEIVVKPAVAGGATDAQRFAAGDHAGARALAATLLGRGASVIVQPYQRAIDRHGETGLVYFAGRASHAIRKGPILAAGPPARVEGLFAAEDISARRPAECERAVAAAALAAVPGGQRRLLYARVDVVPDPDGSPRVLELEVVEPSVFLASDAGAAARFAAAVAEW